MNTLKRAAKALVILATIALHAMAQPRLVFASDATFPPMEYLDGGKHLVGFDIDLVREVARAGGFEAVVKNTAWDGIFAGLAAGEYDAVASSVGITRERQAAMDFSAPYLDMAQVIVVRQETRGLTELSHFAGRKMGSQIGIIGAMEVARHKDIRLRTYDDIGLAVEDLALGRLDGVVVDEATAANYVLHNETYRARLKIVGAPFAAQPYGFAVRKGHRKALDLIERGLAEVRRDGTLDRLKRKWLK